MKGKSVIAAAAALCLISSVIAGCAPAPTASPAPAATAAATPAAPAAPAQTPSPTTAPASPAVNQPTAQESITIRGLAPFTPSADRPEIKSWADHYAWKELGRITGVTVEWEHVTGNYAQQLGLVMASGNIPDLIVDSGAEISSQYGAQGALIDLKQLIESDAPHLSAVFDQHKQVAAQVIAPDGRIYFFPRVMIDDFSPNWTGWMIRKDWLDQTGKAMPGSMDEFYDVLKAMKDDDPKRYPLAFTPNMVVWEFGVGCTGQNNATDFFIENGELKYGPTDARYKDALVYLNRLYTEGLLDPEYLTINDGTKDTGLARIAQGIAGVAYGSLQGYLIRFNLLLTSQNEPAAFVAMPPPGEGNLLGRHNTISPNNGVSIASTSKHPERITQMIDYLYSDEGRLLLSFGEEGDTYTMTPNGPAYTDKVLKSPLGVLAYRQTYIGNTSILPHLIMSEMYVSGIAQDPEAVKGNQIASQYTDDIKLPALQFTSEERSRKAALERDISTFLGENMNAFIMGEKGFDAYDAFQSELLSTGIEELGEIYGAAYARYKSVMGE